MIKKHRTIEHLNSLILGSIENDRLDELRYYISVYPPTKTEHAKRRGDFIRLALFKCKYESSKFLYDMGFSIGNPDYILSKCPIGNISNVYNLIFSLIGGKEYKPGKPNKNLANQIINRILEPNKVLMNPNRIDVAMKYVESGFLKESDFENALNEISIKHKDSPFKGVVNQYVREYKLNKILDNKHN